MDEVIEIYKIDQLLELVDSNGTVKCSITFRGGHISEIRHVKTIEGGSIGFSGPMLSRLS